MPETMLLPLTQQHAALEDERGGCSDSEAFQAVIALLDFQEHAAALLHKHELAEGGACACPTCEDLQGLIYTVRIYEAVIQGELLPTRPWYSRVRHREVQLRLADDARAAAVA